MKRNKTGKTPQKKVELIYLPFLYDNTFLLFSQMHFQEDDWKIIDGRKTTLLKPTAIPKIFYGRKLPTKKRRSPFKRNLTSETPPPKVSKILSSTEKAQARVRNFHPYCKEYSPSKAALIQSPFGTPEQNSLTPTATTPNSPMSTPVHLSENNQPPQSQLTSSSLPNVHQTINTDTNPIRTPNKHNQVVVKLRKNIMSQRYTIRQLRNKINNLQKKVKVAQNDGAFNKIFNLDQIHLIKSGNKKVRKWSTSTLKTAFQIRFACGISGYEELLRLKYPLPSIRTLTRHLEHIKFNSGILSEVIERLEIKVKAMKEEERDCVLLLDEMSITSKTEYDTSSGSFVGDVTLPGHKGPATHALVLMVAGINSRWKQTVGYYFTGNSINGSILKNIVSALITSLEKISLKVHCVTSDMGAANQAMWKAFDIKCTRNEVVNQIEHPADPTRKLYFMPDVPHVYKNIRGMFLSHKVLGITKEIAEKYNLPSTKIELDHVGLLIEYDKDKELKLAPKLDSSHLESTHFDKMKVSTAFNLLHRKNGIALEWLVKEKNYSKNLLTTAWFLKMVYRWFELMTSRSPTLALSMMNPEKYKETLQFLEDMITIFLSLRFGTNEAASWKPIQTGLIMATRTILQLQKFFLVEKNYHFLLTSRFSQDCLENLFSLVRLRIPLPSPLQFKRHLKLITVAQYIRSTSSSSYSEDDRQFLGDFFDQETRKNLEAEKESEKENEEICQLMPLINQCNVTIDKSEQNSLYNLSGYIMHKVSSHDKVCETCVNSLVLSAEERKDSRNYRSYMELAKAKEFKEGNLHFVNEKCFSLMTELEVNFRKSQMLFPEVANLNHFLTSLLSSKVLHMDVLCCHEIKTKIINRFKNFRLRIYAAQNSIQKGKIDYGSKSVCMRSIAKNLKTKKQGSL